MDTHQAPHGHSCLSATLPMGIIMKKVLALAVLTLSLLLPTVSTANDFDWMRDFNVRAEADQDGVRLRLQKTFNINGAEIDVVWSNTKDPADAFNVIALADISDRPLREVLTAYEKSAGWGNLAKQLGIKPGSAEFHALKTGNYGQASVLGEQASSGKGKSNGNGKGKN